MPRNELFPFSIPRKCAGSKAMRRLLILGALFLPLNLLPAQQEGGGGPAPAPDSKQMYEDIEIMRRILVTDLFSSRAVVFLAKGCERCHRPTPSSTDEAGYLAGQDHAHSALFLGTR